MSVGGSSKDDLLNRPYLKDDKGGGCQNFLIVRRQSLWTTPFPVAIKERARSDWFFMRSLVDEKHKKNKRTKPDSTTYVVVVDFLKISSGSTIFMNRWHNKRYLELVCDRNQVLVSGTETKVQFWYRSQFFFLIFFFKLRFFLISSHFLRGYKFLWAWK